MLNEISTTERIAEEVKEKGDGRKWEQKRARVARVSKVEGALKIKHGGTQQRSALAIVARLKSRDREREIKRGKKNTARCRGSGGCEIGASASRMHLSSAKRSEETMRERDREGRGERSAGVRD